MNIRICSDLHLDVSKGHYDLPVLNGDDNTALVVAGDISEDITEVADFLFEMSLFFLHVIFVPGNHEFYGNNYETYVGDLRHSIMQLNRKRSVANIHILQEEEVEIDNTVFIGCTFWTNMNYSNSLQMNHAQRCLNDFNRIIYKGRILTPSDTVELNVKHRDYIMMRTKEHEKQGKNIVVITHHAPSLKSIHPRYQNDALNCCFASDYANIMKNREIDLWIHGHTHSKFDYFEKNTRVICNPHGYTTKHFKEETFYSPCLTIAL